MSDSDAPQHTPPDDGAPDESAAPVAGEAQLVPQAAPSVIHTPDERVEPSVAPSSTPSISASPVGGGGRLGELLRGRTGAWAAAAVLCLLAGSVASVLGASAVANHDASKTRTSFAQTSAAIASTLKLAIQNEEDLASGASTFFAGDPHATPTEFDAWARWTRAFHNYPELQNLGLVTLVRAPELAAFQARLKGHVLPVPGGRSAKLPSTLEPSAKPPASTLHVVPPSGHRYYCLAVAELTRGSVVHAPAGLDYCALSPALLLARDAGAKSYASLPASPSAVLAVVTPVYRGDVTPHTTFGRMAASVGWLREVLAPSVLLGEALRSYPGNAASLRYRTISSNMLFSSGAPHAGAQSTTIGLHGGWSLVSFGAPVHTSVFSNGNSLAVLIGGIVLSVLFGLLLLALGATPRPPSTRPEPRAKVPPNDLYDGLTGLPNRALAFDRASCMVARAGRHSGMLAGALFIDIDWLKDVNEKLGEAAGDHLLKIVAERLNAVVRTGDTVGRLGGDEFVVLVESAAKGVRLDSLARRIIESLHKPVELEGFGPSFFFTASIGVAFGRYETPDDLLRDAQLALHAAKAAGKDRYTLFNANMRTVIESRAVLEDELNSALAEKEFFLLYQPIYELGSGRVAGLEALIRWLHPKRGVLEPSEFLPLAEESGLIVPIGRWALEEACARAAAWNVAGHRLVMSVKVSANQLNRDGFATDVRRALQQSGIEPSLLALEIAETTVMRDLAATALRLAELKQLGVRITIDDFGGSGYARHSDLQRIPLDFLKVDRSSLAASEDEDYRSWLLEAILIVGRDLSLTVIATGVETYEQMTALQTMGCTMAQGSFTGRPTAADAVGGLLEAGFPTGPASSSGMLN